MLAYAVRRVLLLIPTFFGITFIAFSIMLLAPGDPVDMYLAGGLEAGSAGISTQKLADVAKANVLYEFTRDDFGKGKGAAGRPAGGESS